MLFSVAFVCVRSDISFIDWQFDAHSFQRRPRRGQISHRTRLMCKNTAFDVIQHDTKSVFKRQKASK